MKAFHQTANLRREAGFRLPATGCGTCGGFLAKFQLGDGRIPNICRALCAESGHTQQ